MIDLSAREAHEARRLPPSATPRRFVTPPGAHRIRISHATMSHTRDNEWLLARVMVGWAVVLALPGNSLSGPSFAAFHRFPWMTETFWACLFGLIGGLRLFALWVNGRSPRSPYGRMVGAGFGMVAWLVITILILESSLEQLASVSPGFAVYGMFVYAEARSLWRAGYDARYTPGH